MRAEKGLWRDGFISARSLSTEELALVADRLLA